MMFRHHLQQNLVVVLCMLVIALLATTTTSTTTTTVAAFVVVSGGGDGRVRSVGGIVNDDDIPIRRRRRRSSSSSSRRRYPRTILIPYTIQDPSSPIMLPLSSSLRNNHNINIDNDNGRRKRSQQQQQQFQLGLAASTSTRNEMIESSTTTSTSTTSTNTENDNNYGDDIHISPQPQQEEKKEDNNNNNIEKKNMKRDETVVVNDEETTTLLIVVKKFTSTVQESINDGTFVSLTIRGNSMKKKKQQKQKGLLPPPATMKKNSAHADAGDDDDDNLDVDKLRGCIRQIQGRLVQVASKKTNKKKKTNQNQPQQQQQQEKELMLQLTYKYHYATDIVKNWNVDDDTIPTRLENLILLNDLPLDATDTKNNDDDIDNETKNSNMIASEWGTDAILQSQIVQGGELTTINNVWDLQLYPTSGNNNNKNKKPKLIKRKLPKSKQQQLLTATTTTDTNDDNNKDDFNNDKYSNNYINLSHDRTKQVPLSNQSKFLQALGVTNFDGIPKPGMKSKLRQCQKFVEIVGGLVDKQMIGMKTNIGSNSIDGGDSNNQKHSKSTISVVDMGCGRGYLTFALHSYLSEHYYSSGRGKEEDGGDHDGPYDEFSVKVKSCGIDVRPKLVKEISNIATSLGGHFDTLTFEEGTIEGIVQQQQQQQQGLSSSSTTIEKAQSTLDVLIALHACDTATDDALWSGICRNADIIVVAPCCHKQVRPQINAHFAAGASQHDNGNRHPLADVLRHGVYRERLSETVTDSLRALLLEWAGYKTQVFEFIGGEHTSKNVMITAVKQQQSDPPLPQVRHDIEERINTLASFHGIRQQKLADWIGVELGKGEDDPIGSGKAKTRISPKKMPPLNK